jgi:hypothetical protein
MKGEKKRATEISGQSGSNDGKKKITVGIILLPAGALVSDSLCFSFQSAIRITQSAISPTPGGC